MATVNLPQVVLADAAALNQPLLLDASAVKEADEVTGEVRTYAGGRRRAVRRAAEPNAVTLTVELFRQRPALATLRDWKGRVVLYRDPRGRKTYGVYWKLDGDENVNADLIAVTFTIERLSRTDAV